MIMKNRREIANSLKKWTKIMLKVYKISLKESKGENELRIEYD